MPNHVDIENGQLKEMQAQSLLALVKDHDKNCKGNCGISLFALFPLYKKLKGEGAIKDLEHFNI